MAQSDDLEVHRTEDDLTEESLVATVQSVDEHASQHDVAVAVVAVAVVAAVAAVVVVAVVAVVACIAAARTVLAALVSVPLPRLLLVLQLA